MRPDTFTILDVVVVLSDPVHRVTEHEKRKCSEHTHRFHTTAAAPEHMQQCQSLYIYPVTPVVDPVVEAN